MSKVRCPMSKVQVMLSLSKYDYYLTPGSSTKGGVQHYVFENLFKNGITT